ncbi:MAG: MBL fold metallo-hydrolase [Pseudomonadota bacterium]
MADGVIRFPWEVAPGDGEMVEVASGVHWIRLPLPMKLDHVNVYALEDEDGWSLVDTGLHSKRGVALWSRLLEGPLANRPLRRILLTHHHPDHVGNAGWLAARTGAEIWASRTAWLMARMLTLDVQERATPEQLAFYRSAGMAPEMLEARTQDRPYNFSDMVAPIPLGFRRLQDGQTLTLGGRVWRVRMGHGHAPEHATLWSEDGTLVLAGDQILPGISPNLGVYPTEPEADTVGDWMEACARLRAGAENSALCLPGHKLPFTGIATRLGQLIDNHHQALARLRAHLSAPRTAHECFAPLYRREIGAGEYGLALAEAVGHLNHLHAMGETTRARRPDGAWAYRMKQDTDPAP